MDASLLIHYEAIDEASSDMLAAARIGAWERVLEIERACLVLIARLRRAQAKSKASGAAHSPCKSRLMQRLLQRDAEVRRLIEEWRDHDWQQRPAVLH